LFFYSHGGRIGHVALYIGNGQIVHAQSARTGIVISNAFYSSPACVVRVLP
jgi:cell wall-associated NlpC family hydrolase